ncbi:MAG TPA: sugar transferase, partial [Lacipirellulaceae bacterium]|nr:sugar transferase [Lacipirellulaceae bacterium]
MNEHVSNPNSPSPVSPVLVRNGFRLADIAIAVLAALAAHQIYLDQPIEAMDGRYAIGISLAALLVGNIFPIFGLYEERHWRNWFRQVARPLLAWSVVLSLLIVGAFVAKVSTDFSRGWTIVWFACGCVGFLAVRICLRALLARWRELGRLSKSVAIVGAGPVGERLISHLLRNIDQEMRLVGVYDDIPPEAGHAVAGLPYLGNVETLLADARRQRIDQIVVAMPWSEEVAIVEVFRRLWALPVDIRLAPDMIGYRLTHCSFGSLGDVPVLHVFDRPLSDEKMLLKRLEDFVLASTMLIAFAPLMLVIAMAIRLTSPGPIVFRQPRYGFNNQFIQVYKFRTMRVHVVAPGELVQARENDPRVTALGA